MTDQTIKPVLPITKTKNSMQDKKGIKKHSQPVEKKSVDDDSKKDDGRIDTYA